MNYAPYVSLETTWSNTTFALYIAIIVVCYIISLSANYHKHRIIRQGSYRRELWEILVPMILLFFKGFGSTGRDLRTGYYYNFQSATSLAAYRDQTVELGYRLLSVLVRNLTDNYAVFIFIMGLLTLCPVFYFLRKYKKLIDVPTAILMYCTIFYFNSFSPMRITIAASIALFAFDAMVEKRPWRSMFWILVSTTFHFTTLVLFIPYVFVFFKAFNKRRIALSLLLFAAAVFVARGSLASVLSGSDRYNIYAVNQGLDIGMEQIVYFFPLFLLMLWGGRYFRNRSIKILSVSIIGTAFTMGMLSYIVPIFGRFRDVFVPMIFIIPMYVRVIKQRKPKLRIAMDVFAVIYCLARFYIYISQYYIMEDLMPYTNIFGWII